MRRMLLLILFGCAFVPISHGQDYFVKAVKKYYRVNPFDGSFSAFINALTKDDELLNKAIYKQTDTTGFFLKGQYDVFNPFSINANKIDVLFYEHAYHGPEGLGDRASVYSYQLTAFFPDTELTRKKIKQDYNSIVRAFRKDLFRLNRKSLKNFQNIADGEVVVLSHDGFAVLDPAIISWQTIEKGNQVALTLIIRIQQRNNKAFPL